MAKTDPDTWMWERARALLDEADRRTREFCRPVRPAQGGRADRSACWQPPADLYETDSDLWILVALPGVEAEGVEILVDGAALVVRGVRRVPAELYGATPLRVEIPHGRFERRVALPRGRYQLVRRDLVEGCLSIRLQKVL